MTTIEQRFSLIPFPVQNIPQITITGNIARHNNVLTLHYSLSGEIGEVFLPSPSAQPSRRDELWQTTCFEFFLAVKGRAQYWEFNMSPTGDWNIYHMDSYRRIGFREETSFQRLPLEARKETGMFTLDTKVDLAPILSVDQLVEVGLTAVVQTRDGNVTYWALTHPADQADFHRRESFILALAGRAHPSPPSAPES